MCLKLKSWVSSPKRKRRDITCYKVIEVKHYSGGLSTFRTPCTHSCLPFAVIQGNEDYTAVKTWSNVMSPIRTINFKDKYIADGFIHAFKHLESAKTFAEQSDEPLYMRIYECIIPAGTEYYQGMDQLLETKAYAAEKISFIRRVV